MYFTFSLCLPLGPHSARGTCEHGEKGKQFNKVLFPQVRRLQRVWHKRVNICICSRDDDINFLSALWGNEMAVGLCVFPRLTGGSVHDDVRVVTEIVGLGTLRKNSTSKRDWFLVDASHTA